MAIETVEVHVPDWGRQLGFRTEDGQTFLAETDAAMHSTKLELKTLLDAQGVMMPSLIVEKLLDNPQAFADAVRLLVEAFPRQRVEH
jgi:hypothetical protein